ncbi:MAG: hypothetical protein OEV42_00675 [Deltaproteobacteria bacterium]|nr:hypothetical protein [Deltaproteobacteria bacterium]
MKSGHRSIIFLFFFLLLIPLFSKAIPAPRNDAEYVDRHSGIFGNVLCSGARKQPNCYDRLSAAARRPSTENDSSFLLSYP